MTKENKNMEKLEGWLYAYLGAMNILGAMAGKTTDAAIEQRDKAVADILKHVRSITETAKQEEKERIILAIRKTLVVEGVLSLSVEKALAELKALNPTKL